MKQLRSDQVRDLVVHLLTEEHDPLAEQARIDVEGALRASVLLDHHRYDRSDQHQRPPQVMCNLSVAL